MSTSVITSFEDDRRPRRPRESLVALSIMVLAVSILILAMVWTATHISANGLQDSEALQTVSGP